MKREATAVWHGDLRSGEGKLTTGSGTLSDMPYSFRGRFESDDGTNPEELIAAAHAGCFAMALSAELSKAGLSAENIRTDATLNLEQKDGAWTISDIQLGVAVTVPDASEDQVNQAFESAKKTCVVSRALNPDINVDVKLAGWSNRKDIRQAG